MILMIENTQCGNITNGLSICETNNKIMEITPFATLLHMLTMTPFIL